MASYTYWEDEVDVGEDIQFTPADVDACEDRKQLQEWLDGLEVMADHIRAQLDAARHAGHDDDAWVYKASRALAFAGIGTGRVRRRMKALGFIAMSSDAALNELQRKLQCAKAEAAFGRAFVHHARMQLSSQEFRRLEAEAVTSIEPQQEAA